ncbi:DUF5060 domain-containing protein [Blautia schinkii]|nr:DUF5060 domain-containing protein [Blautia schinkii]
MRQYEMFELEFIGEAPQGSWVDVDLTAEFICDGEVTVVKGFYAGEGVYKVRFLPRRTGTFKWKTTGIVEKSGKIHCEAGEVQDEAIQHAVIQNAAVQDAAVQDAAVQNAAVQGTAMGTNALEGIGHGMVQAEGMHFVYEDGTRYTPVGTTVYALPHQPQALIDQTFDTLAGSPYNKLRWCVFPKSFPYNENEPDFYPFEKTTEGKWDVHRPAMEFWNHFEKILMKLEQMGIQSDIILFHPYDRWGFCELSMEENLVYLDYVLRRLSAFPSVWWSMANEYDMMLKRGMEDWYVIEEYIAENDPYHHLLSNHQCVVVYDFSRKNITHCSLQIRDVDRVKEFMEKYQKPVIYDECAYEGDLPMDWGNISGFELVHRFWGLYAQGAYGTHGEVFLSPDDVLWWAKGGILKGESTPRIAYLKGLLKEADGPLAPWELKEFAKPEENQPLDELLKDVRRDNPVANLYYYGKGPERDGMFVVPEYAARYEHQFFLQYLGHTAPSVVTLYLPEDASYRIDVIDTWEMTRKQAYFGASGKVEISLPGKECIAVVAVRL